MWNDEILERIRQVDPATIGHHVANGYMHAAIKPINRHTRVLGPAFTVLMEGRDAGPLHLAFQEAPKGSVIVVDHSSAPEYAPVGDIVALYAKTRGFAGIVIDGAVTDSLGIEALGYPVFSTGISVVTTEILGISGAVNVPIVCAGAYVRPGDIIFGDADGVVVLPEKDIGHLLEKAEAGKAREEAVRKRYLEGKQNIINIEALYQAHLRAEIARLKKLPYGEEET